jgi:hypothetical protein
MHGKRWEPAGLAVHRKRGTGYQFRARGAEAATMFAFRVTDDARSRLRAGVTLTLTGDRGGAAG